MKAVLINPPAFEGTLYVREGRCEQRLSSFQYNMVPISLLTTAAVLRQQGHDVRVIDAIARELTPAELLEELRAFDPRLILASVATATFRGDARVAAAIRKAIPGAFLVGFGVHVTALPEESLLEASGFDAVIRREPEVTAAELARALSGSSALSGVAGLSYRSGDGAIRHNTDRPFLEDLDSLPFPARDLVDHRLYPAPLDRRPHTLVITSRGCPFRCTFCTARLYYGRKQRRRDPVLVVDEIERASRELGLRLFTFWSDTFTLDRAHVLALCREIERRGLRIEWMANSRVDCVDVPLLREMRAAGCSIVSFGVESGVQELLDRMRKGSRLEQAAQAFEACRAVGLRSAAHFILGLPGETPATIRETLRFARRLRPDFVQFYGAIPFPGTDYHREALREGSLVARDWSDYEINRCIVRSPELSREQLQRWRQRAYLTTYMSPRFIAARLTEIRSPREFGRIVRAGVHFLCDWVFPAR